jgi:hypothetical protein
MKIKARHAKKRQLAFDIFTTSTSGGAHHIESVETLAAARQHLKQLARTATGDCFIYSKQNGIVELFIKSDPKNPPLTMPSLYYRLGDGPNRGV